MGLEVAIAATIIAGTVSTVANLQSAHAQKRQAEVAAQEARLRADAEAKQREQELLALLATNNAVAGAIGIDPSSRSFFAIQEGEKKKATEDIKNIKMFGALSSQRYGLQADAAQTAGVLGAIGGIAGTVGGIAGINLKYGEVG